MPAAATAATAAVGVSIWLLSTLVIGLVFPLAIVKTEVTQLNLRLNSTAGSCNLASATAFEACVQNGSCVGGNVVLHNITTQNLVVTGSLDATSCANVVPVSCIPPDMVKTTVSSPLTTLFGPAVTCPDGAINAACVDISMQPCSTPLASDCFSGGNYTFSTVTVNSLNLSDMTVAIDTANLTSVQVESLNVTNSAVFTGSATCPTQPAIDASTCISLGATTQCSSPFTDSCVPSSITLGNSTVSSNLIINQVTCASSSVFAPNCFSSLLSGPNLTANVITGNLNGIAGSFTGPLAGDVAGTQGATTVTHIHGIPMSAATPSAGQVIASLSDGSWAPVSPSTLAGTPAGDATGTLGAIVASGIQGTALASSGATEGQILQKYVSPSAWKGNSQTYDPYYSFGIEFSQSAGNRPYAILKGAQYWTSGNTTYVVQKEGMYRVRMASLLGAGSFFGCAGSTSRNGDCMALNDVCQGYAGNRAWDITGGYWYNEGTAYFYAVPGDLISGFIPETYVFTVACARCFIEIYRHSD